VKPLAKRVILTLTAVPALFSLIYFLPYYNHLGFVVLVVLAIGVGSYEMRNLLFTESEPLVAYFLVPLLPLVHYFELRYYLKVELAEFLFIAFVLIAFFKEIFWGIKDNYEKSLKRIARSVFLLIYPGFLSIFLVKILFFKEATLLLLFLFLLVFGNDTFAYIFGMSLGSNNRNIFKVSPNKSLAGFIGGIASTMAISFAYVYFIRPMREMIGLPYSLVIGFVIAIVSNVGDLIESVFKRGANVKDSGTIIMGRGGILDSIDSLLASAPIYVLMILIIG
jgi:phosphatidate cytidylyltransferase